ncbi:MAG: mechanosensitive ion channel family protein [Bacteroidota bacterium]
MKQPRFTVVFILLFCCSLGHLLPAQVATNPELNLSSPYNSIYTHLYYLQTDSYQPALAAKSLQVVADSARMVQLAIQLKQILDGQGLYIHLNLLPQQNNYLDSTTQKAYYTPFPNRLPEVYLEKVGDQWFYSKATIDRIPSLHKKVFPFGTDLLLNLFPQSSSHTFLGLALWQYLAILFLLLIAALFYRILSRMLMPLVRRIAMSRIRSEHIDSQDILKIARIISLLLLVQLIKIFLPVLQLPIGIAELSIIGVNIMLTVLLVILALRILNLVMSYAMKYAQTTEHKLDEQLMPILSRMLSFLFVIGGLIQILRLLDVNVTALIAGISIGGLALALAAQDTVKNLIGSAMIFIDRPFQIGDFIEVNGHVGTVMEVGFRTSRIRTGDTSIISIPNGNIANMAINNKGVRVYRLFSTKIGLTYDTPLPLIEQYVEGLKQIVLHHPHTRKEDYYIHLNELADSSLNILFWVYLVVPSYAAELKAKEELLFAVLRLAQFLGVNIAFPSSTVYVEGLPAEKSAPVQYSVAPAQMEKRLAEFLSDFQKRHPATDTHQG